MLIFAHKPNRLYTLYSKCFVNTCVMQCILYVFPWYSWGESRLHLSFSTDDVTRVTGSKRRRSVRIRICLGIKIKLISRCMATGIDLEFRMSWNLSFLLFWRIWIVCKAVILFYVWGNSIWKIRKGRRWCYCVNI